MDRLISYDDPTIGMLQMYESGPIILHIVNVVATARLGVAIGPETAAMLRDAAGFPGPAVEFDPDKFDGVTLRYRHPRGTVRIFRSGSVMCNGAKSAGDAKRLVERCIGSLVEAGVEVPDASPIGIANVVASANLGARIDLEAAARGLPRSIYEPDQFSGIIHRMIHPQATLLLFASGMAICTGTRSEADLRGAVSALRMDLYIRNLFDRSS